MLFCDILRYIIIQLHFLFDCIVDFIFGIYYNRKAKKVPAVKNSLLLESAISLAEKIRTKKVTSEEIVRAYTERCKEVNSLINAIVEDRYSDAIEEAKGVDAMIEKCTDLEKIKITMPFFGVPFTTKESNRAKGLIHSMGLLCRRNYRSEDDATTVRFLKEAGGILIAKTNVPELNLWAETRNNLYGQTNNPYDITRTVGGSSGGEAAIVAACGAPFSICSDIGGSTRMPAFFNGLFGHKPSEVGGIGLRENDYPDTMVAAGPLCKKAEDLAPLLKVLISPNVHRLKLDEPVNVQKLKVFYQESSGDLRASKINRTMQATLIKVVQHFRKLTGSATKEKLGDNGVLFYPSAPFPASYHYSTYLRPFNFGYWCLFNVLRFPSCQVPLGLDEQGLPVGIQVIAAPYNDHLCFAVAKELETTFGGWVPPS
ncbi:hypothetical protein ACFW04_010053 [Cataglyphis niger]